MTGVEPLKFAKPSPLLADFIKDKFTIKDPKRVLFVGDMLNQDMGFANAGGFQKLLVLTGDVQKETLQNWDRPEVLKPDYYLDSFPSIIDVIDNYKDFTTK